MREQLPTNKQAGQKISPRHINDLSRIFRRLGRSLPGSNQTGYHGDSLVSKATPPPWQQGIMEITVDNGGDQFEGQMRYYSRASFMWALNTEHLGWDIDGSDVPNSLVVGDRVVCYWNEQRGAFIPICCAIAPDESSSSASSDVSSQSDESSISEISSSFSSASSTSVECRCRDGECVWEWDDFSSVSGLGGTGQWILITDTCTAVCQPAINCICTNGPTRDGLFDGEQWIGDCVAPP